MTQTARIPLPPLGTLGLSPVGRALYAQALLVQHPVESRLTNVTADVVLR